MKKGYLLTILAGVLAVFLLIMVMNGQVVLYTAVGNVTSHDHLDASTITPMTTEEAETILPLMEDLMKLSNNVVLEIRYTDKESALRTLKAYENSLSRLNTNSIKVKITGTDINQFKKDAAQLREELGSLLNNTDRLKELQKLQVQYEDSDNPGVVYELAYEGEALRKEIERAAGSYIKSAENMMPIAEEYDRDTSQLQESIQTVIEILEESDIETETIRQIQQAVQQSSVTPPGSITLTLSPDVVSYGDVLTLRGAAKYVPLSLTLYLDGKVWGTVSAATNGDFEFSFRVQQLVAGEHTVLLVSGGVSSPIETFTVRQSPTYLNITDVREASAANGTAVTVTGVLVTTNERAVTSVPVEVYTVEGELLSTAVTTQSGFWTGVFELPDGEYTIFASFSDASYPLDESRSEESVLSLGTPGYYYLLILLIGGVVVILLIRYRKKIQELFTTVESVPPLPQTRPVREKTIPKLVKKFLVREKVSTDTDQLRLLYKATITPIAQKIGLRNLAVYTPREFLRAVPDPSDDIKEFISLYEYLHYANVVADEMQMNTMRELSQKISEAYHESTE